MKKNNNLLENYRLSYGENLVKVPDSKATNHKIFTNNNVVSIKTKRPLIPFDLERQWWMLLFYIFFYNTDLFIRIL